MNKHYRQGDVVLVEIEDLPEGASEELVSDDIVLALGEATGHSHRLRVPEGATLYAVGDSNVVQLKKPGNLVHEEHDAISLAPGFYRVVRQREYTPERITRVID
ncbi:MAG TPA: hypothetical protein V6C97_28515 [Oculatellaceae cyanobacterium]